MAPLAQCKVVFVHHQTNQMMDLMTCSARSQYTVKLLQTSLFEEDNVQQKIVVPLIPIYSSFPPRNILLISSCKEGVVCFLECKKHLQTHCCCKHNIILGRTLLQLDDIILRVVIVFFLLGLS